MNKIFKFVCLPLRINFYKVIDNCQLGQALNMSLEFIERKMPLALGDVSYFNQLKMLQLPQQ